MDSAGDLPAGFGPLLEAVPRERFIPDRIWVNREPIDRVAEPERWARAVYGDESIVTQFDDGRTRWPDVGRLPTCSASMPSVVVGMLDALRVQPGQRVLEVGTGTGFGAALLAELVGDAGGVVTVEIDDGLARAPWPLLQVPSPRWALAVALPSCRYDVEPGRRAWLCDPVSTSWATMVPLGEKRYLVRQAGVRRLWEEAETAYRWWLDRGEPFITGWEWRITPDRQTINLPGWGDAGMAGGAAWADGHEAGRAV